MRQRKLKNQEEKLIAYRQYLIEKPDECKGKWLEIFKNSNKKDIFENDIENEILKNDFKNEMIKNVGRNKAFKKDDEIYVEFGCGKGKFITALAEKFPTRNYIGIEGHGSVILRALEKAGQKELDNVRFINLFATDVRAYFEANELSGIYLNFSDPWPKKRHTERRLTSIRHLESYKEVLKPGGIIEFKTDNEALFKFTLENLLSTNMEILEQTDDLHNTLLASKEFMTEYEEKFMRLNRKIFYLKAKIPS